MHQASGLERLTGGILNCLQVLVQLIEVQLCFPRQRLQR